MTWLLFLGVLAFVEVSVYGNGPAARPPTVLGYLSVDIRCMYLGERQPVEDHEEGEERGQEAVAQQAKEVENQGGVQGDLAGGRDGGGPAGAFQHLVFWGRGLMSVFGVRGGSGSHPLPCDLFALYSTRACPPKQTHKKKRHCTRACPLPHKQTHKRLSRTCAP